MPLKEKLDAIREVSSKRIPPERQAITHYAPCDGGPTRFGYHGPYPEGRAANALFRRLRPRWPIDRVEHPASRWTTHALVLPRALVTPYCRTELEALQTIYADVKSSGGELVVFSAETTAITKGMADKQKLEFPIVRDTDFDIARSFASCSHCRMISKLLTKASASICRRTRGMQHGSFPYRRDSSSTARASSVQSMPIPTTRSAPSPRQRLRCCATSPDTKSAGSDLLPAGRHCTPSSNRRKILRISCWN